MSLTSIALRSIVIFIDLNDQSLCDQEFLGDNCRERAKSYVEHCQNGYAHALAEPDEELGLWKMGQAFIIDIFCDGSTSTSFYQ